MREKIDDDSVSEDWIEIPMDSQGGVPKEVSQYEEEGVYREILAVQMIDREF